MTLGHIIQLIEDDKNADRKQKKLKFRTKFAQDVVNNETEQDLDNEGSLFEANQGEDFSQAIKKYSSFLERQEVPEAVTPLTAADEHFTPKAQTQPPMMHRRPSQLVLEQPVAKRQAREQYNSYRPLPMPVVTGLNETAVDISPLKCMMEQSSIIKPIGFGNYYRRHNVPDELQSLRSEILGEQYAAPEKYR